MINKSAIYICCLAVLCWAFSSCNSSSDENEYVLSSTKVTAFSLKSNKKILNNLDSIFFSIDLVNAEIFNADSLPYGTNVSKLQLDISTESCSVIELHVPRKDNSDTIVNYIKNSTDSINFSNGPVKLHLVSLDKKAQRDYTIRVNVHKIKPDSLYWDRMALSSLPAYAPGMKAQKTVTFNTGAVCLVQGNDYCSLAYNPNPAESDSWQTKTVSFGFTPVVRSLTSSDNSLFILSSDNRLYQSSDLGETWSDTGVEMSYIYGAFEGTVLGNLKNGNSYLHVTFPASTSYTLSDKCPVSGTSDLAFTTTEWSSKGQCYFVGGTLADGSKSNATWGYDGEKWAMISSTLPIEISDMTMFAYKIATTDTITWSQREYPCLIALGGMKSDNTLNDKVFVSRDFGMNWKIGDDLLQLPSYIPAMASADALVFDAKLSDVSNSSRWTFYAPASLPPYMSPFKAVKPITEWECPFIFMFGGTDIRGTLFNTVWRGVINRLTFKPLQ